MRIFYTLALVASTLSTFAQVQISGTVKSGDKVYLQKFKDKVFYNVDSAVVKQGKFQFQANIPTPELYGLAIDAKAAPQFLFIDQNDKQIEVQLDSSQRYRNTLIKGSTAQDIYSDYLKNQRTAKIEDIIQAHPHSIVPAYLLYRNFAYRLDPEEIQKNIAVLSPEIQKSVYVENLKNYIKTLEHVALGKVAPDFTQNDVNDTPVTLSSLRGKYVLIDFWAAWCGPCRKENPNVVAAYQEFKNHGFDILGVSLDRDKAAWLKAIEKDELTWTQVSDLKYWQNEASTLYGVRAIPANFLLDPDGKIIAKNLQGEQLHSTLKRIFKLQ